MGLSQPKALHFPLFLSNMDIDTIILIVHISTYMSFFIMSVDGGEWKSDDLISYARFNLKSNWTGTAEQAANINKTYPGMSIFTTTDGHGFLKNTAYRRNDANNSWVVDTAGRHRHDSDTEASGGLFSDMVYYNLHKFLLLNRPTMHFYEWYPSLSTGATISEDYINSGVVLDTGNVINQYAAIKDAGIRMDWSKPARFIIKAQASAGAQITIRIGVNIEHANDANSTANMIGIEACDTVGTTRNYDIVSANGGIRSSVATTEPAAAVVDHAYALDFSPGLFLKFSVDGVLVGTKTSHLPTTGSTSTGNLVQVSIKTNDSASNKILRVKAVGLIGVPGDSAWRMYTG